MAPVRVVACGNRDAGDDAAALLAVELAAPDLRAIDGVDVVPVASPLDVVHLLEDASAAVVVDAIRTPQGARAPGAIVRVDAGRGGVPAAVRSSLSSHGLGIAETLALASALGTTPRVVILGVEAATSAPGDELSPAVRAALPHLARMVVEEATSLARRAERSPR